MPAKVVTPDGLHVYYHKFCSTDGISQNWVHGDLATYLETQRYVKPAWTHEELSGQSDKPCPHGCGLCDRHEQHLCMPIVEITFRCDLACPVCIADAGQKWDMTVEEFRTLADRLIRAERQIDVLNLSGGEPLLHPRLLKIVDEALGRPEIVRVSVSTNGLSLLRNPTLVRELHDRNVVIALQFDGFDDGAYEVLRGKRLLDAKLSILNEISSSRFDARRAFSLAERHIKSIFIHAFQDVEDFDLSRVRRCCQAYPQPDGKLIPACVYNVLRRDSSYRSSVNSVTSSLGTDAKEPCNESGRRH